MGWFSQHQTDILTGVGIVGMGAAGVSAAITAPKLKDAIQKRKEELDVEKLPFKEWIKTSWRYLIVPVTAFAGGATCVIMAHVGDKKAAAGYAAAYAASEVALNECKDKITEVVGEKKAKEISESIMQDHAEKDPIDKEKVYVMPGGDHLMRIDWNGYSFRSTVQEVESIVNKLNQQINYGERISVADLCYEFGKEDCDSDRHYIWDANINGIIELEKSGGVTADGEPFIIWGFRKNPVYNDLY